MYKCLTMCKCVNVQMPNVQMHKCKDIHHFICTFLHLHICTLLSIVNAKCADAQMQRYASFHLHIFTFAHLHIVKHLLIKRTAYTYASYFFKMQQALWPPKPKVLLRAARTVRFCALLKVKLRL